VDLIRPDIRYVAIVCVAAVAIIWMMRPLHAEAPVNYDESKVPPYTLPDPLTMADGAKVASARMWTEQRRPELLELFRAQVYGRSLPSELTRVRYDVSVDTPVALRRYGLRKRVLIQFRDAKWPGIRLTLFLPAEAKAPAPAFVGMHLFDTASDEPMPGKPLADDVPSMAEDLPGKRLLEVILAAGYAIGTLDAKDFCPDDADHFREGALATLTPERNGPPGPEEGGAISTWAWGLSRALDYLETDSAIDARRVTVIGHSRMGKTALWAGAQDERFAAVISNNSGCGGAALSRRAYGETVEAITRRFPHWFCGNFSQFADHEDRLSVDQHELVALIAPRPAYIASAVEDRWADPRGEFLSAVGADAVYRLLGKQGLGVSEFPEPGRQVGHEIGYHLRVGKHALTDYDWLRYLGFAKRYLGSPNGTTR
jgi:hypothetical protein